MPHVSTAMFCLLREATCFCVWAFYFIHAPELCFPGYEKHRPTDPWREYLCAEPFPFSGHFPANRPVRDYRKHRLKSRQQFVSLIARWSIFCAGKAGSERTQVIVGQTSRPTMRRTLIWSRTPGSVLFAACLANCQLKFPSPPSAPRALTASTGWLNGFPDLSVRWNHKKYPSERYLGIKWPRVWCRKIHIHMSSLQSCNTPARA